MFDLTNPIYSDANAAREHLETLHWPNGPVCPHCGETERVKRLAGKSTRPGVVMCNPCRKPFTVTVGTIFEDSRIALNKWLLGFRLMAGSKKGISAHQLHRSLGITYKSAWFVAHRIPEAMDIDDGPLGGPNTVVEADETYVGGKAKNRAFRSPAPKKAVVALVERDGRVASKHVRHGEQRRRVCSHWRFPPHQHGRKLFLDLQTRRNRHLSPSESSSLAFRTLVSPALVKNSSNVRHSVIL
jgi:transposase-like protein